MDYLKKIEENRELQIQTLQDLVSIKSVQSNPAATKDGEIFPFGKGVQDAFAYTLNKGKELGFEVKNVDNYGGHIDFGSGSEIVGVLGHLDVVPEGDGWSFDPYSGAVSDGYIYGRGTLDDKGPVIAILFAMKALKDAGYVPAKKIRLILGLDEETGWKGMAYYGQHEETPAYGFTPDAEFPALNGEKGIVTFEIAKKFAKNQNKGLELRSLTGGAAANMVAEHARAVVRSDIPESYGQIRALAASYREGTGYKVSVKGVGKSLEITTEGKSAHGAAPEAGLNAISIMMDFLGQLNFANDDVNDFIQLYNAYIGFDFNGEKLGIGFSDEVSGKLTLNVGLVSYDRESITLTINVRYPVTYTDEQVFEGIMPIINKYDLGIIKGRAQAPIFMDPESPMIKALMEVYQKNTGDYESRPQVIGGGTYARAAKNIVAFGGLFPGDPDLMHQKDERLSIEKLMTMTKIYADAIYKLSQAEFMITEEE
ncbi:Putative dipeptidase SA1572 [uncultured Eubacterium sp.]|nr:Putative dipeptidase SA1572 [uncultured Eubacterium sp.]